MTSTESSGNRKRQNEITDVSSLRDLRTVIERRVNVDMDAPRRESVNFENGPAER